MEYVTKTRKCNVHHVSKKLCHYTFIHNFDKIVYRFSKNVHFHIVNDLQQNPCHISHRTLFKGVTGKFLPHVMQ